MKKTTVLLKPRHFEWKERNPQVSLSAMVREMLDAVIERECKLVKKYVITEWLAGERGIPEEIEAVGVRESEEAVCVLPARDWLPGEIWLPKSQIEKVEPMGLYEKEVDYPERNRR